jgi:5-methylcytosine-specific restriction endonuclease McrA
MKYNGLCAYTGKPLDDKWQVDHKTPRLHGQLLITPIEEVEHIDNLLPCCRIINHYKRGHTLEGFRKYMMSFHIRLSKLPKNPIVPKSIRRKEYMNEVAGLFGITPEKPFDGVFYFERRGDMV